MSIRTGFGRHRIVHDWLWAAASGGIAVKDRNARRRTPGKPPHVDSIEERIRPLTRVEERQLQHLVQLVGVWSAARRMVGLPDYRFSGKDNATPCSQPEPFEVRGIDLTTMDTSTLEVQNRLRFARHDLQLLEGELRYVLKPRKAEWPHPRPPLNFDRSPAYLGKISLTSYRAVLALDAGLVAWTASGRSPHDLPEEVKKEVGANGDKTPLQSAVSDNLLQSYHLRLCMRRVRGAARDPRVPSEPTSSRPPGDANDEPRLAGWIHYEEAAIPTVRECMLFAVEELVLLTQASCDPPTARNTCARALRFAIGKDSRRGWRRVAETACAHVLDIAPDTLRGCVLPTENPRPRSAKTR